MPSWIKDEESWEKAKKQARKQGQSGNYAYTMSIFKKISGYKPKDEKKITKKKSKVKKSMFYFDKIAQEHNKSKVNKYKNMLEKAKGHKKEQIIDVLRILEK